MLENLKQKISKKDAKIRETAFEKASQFIKRASLTNGIDAPANVTFRAEGYVKERVDIEVKKRESIY